MLINYEDADGKIIELEVSDDVGIFYLESVEAEKKNDRKNSRPDRHTQLSTLTYEERAFIKAWNKMIDEKEHYWPEWQQTVEGDDLLRVYRARELMGLVKKIGRIDRVPYELLLKTLDYIAVYPDGNLTVNLLAGIKI